MKSIEQINFEKKLDRKLEVLFSMMKHTLIYSGSTEKQLEEITDILEQMNDQWGRAY